MPASRVIDALGSGNFVVGIGGFVVIGILGPMPRDLGLSKAEAAAVLSAYALASAVTSLVLVTLTGRFQRFDPIGRCRQIDSRRRSYRREP